MGTPGAIHWFALRRRVPKTHSTWGFSRPFGGSPLPVNVKCGESLINPPQQLEEE